MKRDLTMIAHVACNLSFVVKNDSVIKITRSHVYFKSVSVLKTVLDKDVEWTVHKNNVICRNSNCNDLGCMSRLFIDCKVFFYSDKRVGRSLCDSRASCVFNGLDITAGPYSLAGIPWHIGSKGETTAVTIYNTRVDENTQCYMRTVFVHEKLTI